MKLLMTTDTVGGVWSYCLELIRALSPMGIEVSLATMGDPLREDQREEAGTLPNLRLFESAYKLEWMQEPWDDVSRAGQWLLELEQRIAPDIVHLNGYAHARLPFSVPVMVVAHSCVLSWFEAVKAQAAPPQWERYRREVGAGLVAADLVVAPSAAMLDAIVRHYGAPACTRVIYNGRDPLKYLPRHKENMILAAGRVWDPAKNIALLDSIADRLAWPVLVAGQSQFQGDAAGHKRIGALGMLSQDQLRPWFSRAAIYCLPARYEPFGLSVLEAAMSGCALVLGDIASLREIWGSAAAYLNVDDSDGLAHCLGHLCSDPEERLRLAQAAHERSLDYTSRKMGDAYYAAYVELSRSCRATPRDASPTQAGACIQQGPAQICESFSSTTR